MRASPSRAAVTAFALASFAGMRHRPRRDSPSGVRRNDTKAVSSTNRAESRPQASAGEAILETRCIRSRSESRIATARNRSNSADSIQPSSFGRTRLEAKDLADESKDELLVLDDHISDEFQKVSSKSSPLKVSRLTPIAASRCRTEIENGPRIVP
jgi:hypothetical protein